MGEAGRSGETMGDRTVPRGGAGVGDMRPQTRASAITPSAGLRPHSRAPWKGPPPPAAETSADGSGFWETS